MVNAVRIETTELDKAVLGPGKCSLKATNGKKVFEFQGNCKYPLVNV